MEGRPLTAAPLTLLRVGLVVKGLRRLDKGRRILRRSRAESFIKYLHPSRKSLVVLARREEKGRSQSLIALPLRLAVTPPNAATPSAPLQPTAVPQIQLGQAELAKTGPDSRPAAKVNAAPDNSRPLRQQMEMLLTLKTLLPIGAPPPEA